MFHKHLEFRIVRVAVLAVLSRLVLALPAYAGIVNVSGSSQSAIFDEDSMENVEGHVFPSSSFISGLNGVFSSTIGSATLTRMMGEFDQQRRSAREDGVFGEVNVTFNVEGATTYELGGEFFNSAEGSKFWVTLTDWTTNTVLFDQRYSLAQPGAYTLFVGDANVADPYKPYGSTTGALLPQHEYNWVVYAESETLTDSAGVIANGNAWLSVPEPSSRFLLALGVGLLAMMSRRTTRSSDL